MKDTMNQKDRKSKVRYYRNLQSHSNSEIKI
jgi:hypothetical protein